MLLFATLSKPVKNIQEILGRDYIRVKIRRLNSMGPKAQYTADFFTQKQCFTKNYSEQEMNEFLEKNAGYVFKNAVETTDTQEITVMANKKGEIRTIVKELNSDVAGKKQGNGKGSGSIQFNGNNRVKNYIMPEGIPVDFLVELGVMTKEGKVVAKMYDKFRQINRFLEYIDDVLEDVLSQTGTISQKRPLTIVDFGCGKSYLTFAVYYYLSTIKNLPVNITGLDLKQDVIEHCNALAKKIGYANLKFYTGDIAQYDDEHKDAVPPDVVVTLHACDVATDYALQYALEKNASAILSVPCCQHQVNGQLLGSMFPEDNPFHSMVKYGLIKERFAALATDALRGEYLESKGYNVQILEFIDMSHTPKNLLIRAVKKGGKKNPALRPALLDALSVKQELWNS